MKRVAIRVALISLAAVVGAAEGHGLDKCKAKIDRPDGRILVSAKNVVGTLRWGDRHGVWDAEIDQTCVSNGTAKNCVVAGRAPSYAGYAPGLDLETAPETCRLFLSDDAGSCEIRIPQCITGKRPVCPLGMAPIGDGCVDRYEAVVLNDAFGPAGAVQYGVTGDDYPCLDDGSDCGAGSAPGHSPLYAYSLPGYQPSAHITWFQAVAACANVGKRLATNYEWQVAALGTVDAGDDGASSCNTASVLTPTATGSRAACRSARGAFDMVGNLWEWTADWTDRKTGSCGSWSANFGSDLGCVGGDGSSGLPDAIIRGGDYDDAAGAGVFAIGSAAPDLIASQIGFRCAKD